MEKIRLNVCLNAGLKKGQLSMIVVDPNKKSIILKNQQAINKLKLTGKKKTDSIRIFLYQSNSSAKAGTEIITDEDVRTLLSNGDTVALSFGEPWSGRSGEMSNKSLEKYKQKFEFLDLNALPGYPYEPVKSSREFSSRATMITPSRLATDLVVSNPVSNFILFQGDVRSQIRAAIEGSCKFEEIVIVDKSYVVFDYKSDKVEPSDFNDEATIRRECRGLCVCAKTGKVIGRRFHKFFNIDEEAVVNWRNVQTEFVVTIKEDGQMISPIQLYDDSIIWVGKVVENPKVTEYVAKNPNYNDLAKNLLKDGITPIFEWKEQGRVAGVISNPKNELLLIALRNMETGIYWSQYQVEQCGMKYGIPTVKTVVFQNKSLAEITETVRCWEGVEGVVVGFTDGSKLKIKTLWYISHVIAYSNSSVPTLLSILQHYGSISSLSPNIIWNFVLTAVLSDQFSQKDDVVSLCISLMKEEERENFRQFVLLANAALLSSKKRWKDWAMSVLEQAKGHALDPSSDLAKAISHYIHQQLLLRSCLEASLIPPFDYLMAFLNNALSDSQKKNAESGVDHHFTKYLLNVLDMENGPVYIEKLLGLEWDQKTLMPVVLTPNLFDQHTVVPSSLSTNSNISSGYHVFCDLDGVLVDFEAGLEKLSHSRKMQNNDYWKLIEEDPTFFLNLQFSKEGQVLWDFLSNQTNSGSNAVNPIQSLKILTGIPVNTKRSMKSATRQKKEWVKKHLGPNIETICVPSKDKWKYAKSNCILIDDDIRQKDAWIRASGTFVSHVHVENTIHVLKTLINSDKIANTLATNKAQPYSLEEVSYIGVFLDEKSRTLLNFRFNNIPESTQYNFNPNLHVTVAKQGAENVNKMHSSLFSFERISSLSLGAIVKMTLNEPIIDENVIVCEIGSFTLHDTTKDKKEIRSVEEILNHIQHPHITIATRKTLSTNGEYTWNLLSRRKSELKADNDDNMDDYPVYGCLGYLVEREENSCLNAIETTDPVHEQCDLEELDLHYSVVKKLNDFLSNSQVGDELRLPSTLTSEQRKGIHGWCAQHGLKSESFGTKENRRLAIFNTGIGETTTKESYSKGLSKRKPNYEQILSVDQAHLIQSILHGRITRSNIILEHELNSEHWTSTKKRMKALIEGAGLNESSKCMIIFRGLPGSGKSSVVKLLLSSYTPLSPVVCSADDYFESGLGEGMIKLQSDGDAGKTYRTNFNPSVLPLAHAYCQEKARVSMQNSSPLVIIDNTNTRQIYYHPYVRAAKEYKYWIMFIEIDPGDEEALQVYFKRNQHGVPFEVYQKMRREWEDVEKSFATVKLYPCLE